MTRMQAREFLIGLGMENPTEESITSFLNNVNGEVAKEKAKTEKYKEDAEKVVELQKQLDEINSRDLTDLQKAQKDFENAQAEIQSLKNEMKKATTLKGLAEKGFVGEEAESFVNSLMAGDFNIEAFGNFVDSSKKSAVAEYEKKMLGDTPNPKGANPTPDVKSEADKLAESYVKSQGDTNKSSADIVSAYK